MAHMYCKSYLQSPANLSFKSAGQKCAFRGSKAQKRDFAYTLIMDVLAVGSARLLGSDYAVMLCYVPDAVKILIILLVLIYLLLLLIIHLLLLSEA